MSLLARASVHCELGGNISIFVLLVIQKEVLLISLHLGNIYCSDFFFNLSTVFTRSTIIFVETTYLLKIHLPTLEKM